MKTWGAWVREQTAPISEPLLYESLTLALHLVLILSLSQGGHYP